MPLNVEKIYIIHYNKLVERKMNLEKYFVSNNITNYEFRNLYPRENLTQQMKEQYFKFDNLNPAQICITIEHIETYREIINSSCDEWFLILEDDAVFCHDFVNKLNKMLETVPTDAEYLDISDYFTVKSNSDWVKNTSTRTNVSYLIKKNTCLKILQTIIPFEKAIDHELNRQISIHSLNVYWSCPSLVSQGSIINSSSSYVQYR